MRVKLVKRGERDPGVNEITLRRPDDWHVHLRDDAMLHMALPWTARTFGRAIVMPNLDPPLRTAARAAAYCDRIRRVLPSGSGFEPLMTCFLTDETEPKDIAQGFADGIVTAVKMYPARSTTKSAAGVTDVRRVCRVLGRMQAIGMLLLIQAADQEHRRFRQGEGIIDRGLVQLRVAREVDPSDPRAQAQLGATHSIRDGRCGPKAGASGMTMTTIIGARSGAQACSTILD